MTRLILLMTLALSAACGTAEDGRERVLLVTTTTVEDSGLLDVLVEAYHASQDRFTVATTALGSGAALELGRRGDADLLITHDPAGEARLRAEGHVREQGPLMMNDFLLVGPPSDPAGVRDAAGLPEALERIAATGAPFISRADDSGTHSQELQLWERAGLPAGGGSAGSYVEAGSGMAETLRLADQRQGYALTDRGTFRHLAANLQLEPMATGAPVEPNIYQYTLPVEPRQEEGARHLLDWLRGPGQAVIAGYGTDRFGEPLFLPATRMDR